MFDQFLSHIKFQDFMTTCLICHEPIIGSYYIDSWQQIVHTHHEIKLCFNCGRIVMNEGIRLNDGRHICFQCQPSLVKTKQDVDWVNEKTRKMLTKIGFNDIPQDVPIEICDSNKLNSLYGENIINPNQRGLAQFTQLSQNGVFKVEHKVYIIDNLTKTVFAGVLAHELLHVWQNQKNINAPQNITEGFCNLGSFLMYKTINNEVSIKLIDSLNKDENPIYGDGFRKIKEFYDKNGLNELIKRMKGYKQL